jgi:putative PIN family toxin of toxin-antitoxin system
MQRRAGNRPGVRVVIDTNVVVSGPLAGEGTCFDILEWLREGRLEACYSAAILREYARVLGRSHFGCEPSHIDGFLDLIEKEGWKIAGEPLKALKDPDNTKFLEVAVAGRCQYLITGNLKDFPKGQQGTVSIVSPAQFRERVRRR